jgi:hypothetical protein
MANKIYKIKNKYKDTSICPGVKIIKLAFLNQEQITLVMSQGYDKYFEEVKAATKEDK